MSKVSIIIPVFNYGFILEETLKGLVDQSHQNWEAIIVDDGSMDNTSAIVSGFAGKDPRFKYVFQENKGVSAARNNGLRHATGDFIQFLDGDDLLSREKLELQLIHLNENPHIDISYVNSFYFIDGNQKDLFADKEMKGQEWIARVQGRGFNTIKALVDQNIAVISSPLLRREVLDKTTGFTEGKAYLEDWEFWLDLALKDTSYHFFGNDSAYTLIRIHSKSASYEMRVMRISDLIMRKEIETKLRDTSLDDAQKREILELNRMQSRGIFKGLVYNTPLWDIRELRYLLSLPHDDSFFMLYLKSINYHRKLWFKSWVK